MTSVVKSAVKSAVESAVKCCEGGQAKGWRRLGLGLLVVSGLPLSALAENPAQIDRLTQQWLDVERQSRHLQSDWKTQQPLLTQRLALLKAEKQQLRGLLKQSHASKDSVDTRRAELLAEQSELEQQQVQLSHLLTQLTSRLTGIAPLLPPALSTAWQDEERSLGEGAEASMRLQVALAQLTRLADFDARVSVHEGAITSSDGQTLLVKQLYLGASVAWFASRDGQLAGWGQADDSGWHWHFDDSINAAEVGKAIDIFEKRKTAEWVRLPIRLAGRAPSEVDLASHHSNRHSNNNPRLNNSHGLNTEEGASSGSQEVSL